MDYHLTKEHFDYLINLPEVVEYNRVAHSYQQEIELEIAGLPLYRLVDQNGKRIMANFLMWAHPGICTRTRVFVDGEQVDIPSVG